MSKEGPSSGDGVDARPPETKGDGGSNGTLNIQLPISFLLKVAIGGSLWVVRRPFLLSRRRWIVVLVLALVVETVAWIVVPGRIAFFFILPLLVVLLVLVHWWWLGRGKYPIVFVSRFEGQSPSGRKAAETHIGAMVSYLRTDKNLNEIGPIEIRHIPISLSRSQAERLSRISGCLLVVRGSGDAVAELSRWEWWLLFRSEIPDLMMTKYELSVVDNSTSKTLTDRLRLAGPAIAEARNVEGSVEMAAFVSECRRSG